MHHTSNLRGIALMIAASAAFVVCDTFLKLSTEGLPPFQVLFIRGLVATLWSLPLVILTGNLRAVGQVADKWVLARNGMELLAVLCFIVALANMPIADVTALGQTAPMLLLLGVAFVYGERIGAVRMGLIAIGFLGAMLVAQPGEAGISVYALLGFAMAAATALREMVGRKVPGHVPGPVVALGAILVVMVGGLVAHLLFERWVVPQWQHLLFLSASGFFLTIGHLCIFLAYRYGATSAVAPFFYMFTIWAVISGVVVFGTVPDALALTGIALILVSGVAVVLLDERRRRLAPVA
ncbi:DMT family transporter [Devosia sp.]|uniref:DMT family transporter n=1 Tax=Devosia sp. TaxID=1871048 RepID=UPI002F0364A4